MERQTADTPLSLENIPAPDADWDDIWRFAPRFNAYDRLGSFEAVGNVANARSAETLYDLLTCLFFEQRRWRHFEETPTGEDEVYVRGLVRKIIALADAR